MNSETLSRRVETLEGQARRSRLANLGTLGLLALVVLVAARGQGDDQVHEVLRARRIQVVDTTAGFPHALVDLYGSQNGGALMLSERDGGLWCHLTSDLGDNTGSVLMLYDPDGNPSAVLSANDNGSSLGLTAGPKMAAMLAAEAGVGGGLTLLREDSTNAVLAGSSTNGGSLQVHNKTGEVVGAIAVEGDGTGHVGAWDRYGKGKPLVPRDLGEE